MTLARGARADPASERLLAEQMRRIIEQTPQGIAAPGALAVITAVLVSNRVRWEYSLTALSLLAATLYSWYRFYRAHETRGIGRGQAARWARGVQLRTLCHGLIWGGYSLLIFPLDSLAQQSLDVAFMYGLVAGAVVVDASHFPTFLSFAVPTLLPVVARSFVENTTGSFAVGCAGLVGLGHACFAALSAARLSKRSIETDFENAELMRELARQSELAESARAEAEAANRAKSRFLAAASHDLRQPVHALGLFTAAAKNAANDAERVALLERIETSAASLTSLFDSLLEISRLDAGVLTAHVQSVPLAALLSRLELEYSAEARAKELELRVRCPELRAHSDPLLLERVLRNFITNALRYTKKGGILLAARRHADHVRIGVWDTGIGIPADKLAQIFEEFYQLGNPERDRSRGVGLGLAIVERIAKLLGAKVHVASRVGRGSCFAIDVPLAPASGLAREPSALAAELEPLLGTVVALIDDEPTSLEACEVVLKQQGCVVVCASSGQEALLALRARGVEPELLISDYRLRESETGVLAIRALRAEYGHLPALLLTGDTAVERLLDVAGSGICVLHKPVHAETLTGTLASLLTECARPSFSPQEPE